MRVFVTGATGWVGSALVKELIEAGHKVIGLARSEEKARALSAAGGKPLHGSLSDLQSVRQGASMADGVIHLAFGHLDMSKIAEAAEQDRQAIQTFADAYAGSDRPIVTTGGFGILPQGEIFTEARPLGPINPAFPRASEQTTLAVATRGARATWVRLPRAVHGVGEWHGFIPQLAKLAREKGYSAYIGDGQNLWPSVHRLDAARVFRLALEHGAQGGPFHAVADEGIPFRQIAEAMGRQIDVPCKSISPVEAAGHFGFRAMFVAGNGPASSERTRSLLGWVPREPDLISDISQPEYYN